MNFLSSNYINANIARLATRYVGQYLEGIEPEKFEVAWKGGNLQLSDVRIRKEVVEIINLPVSLVYGWVGSVKISLPLGNIFSLRTSSTPQPLIIELDELYIVIAPKPEEQWDEAALIERHRLSRQRFLDECDVRILAEQAQKQLTQNVKAAQQAQGNGWMARLAARVVADIQFHIRSIHLRYEDEIGSSEGPFSAGITLSSLQIRTPGKKESDQISIEMKHGRLNLQNCFSLKHFDKSLHNGFQMEDLYHDLTDRSNENDLSSSSTLTQQKQFCISDIAVYWNSDDSGIFLSSGFQKSKSLTPETLQSIRAALRQMVTNVSSNTTSSSTRIGTDLCDINLPQRFILKPFSCSVLVDVSATQDNEYKHSKYHYSVQQEIKRNGNNASYNPVQDTKNESQIGTHDTHYDLSKDPKLNMSNKQMLSYYRLFVELASLDVAFHKGALRDVSSITHSIKGYTSLASSINDRYELYFPYRPDIPVKGSASIWWRYAVGCVVRRLRQDFPEAFRSKESVWNWGHSLKAARVASWRDEFQEALLQFLQESQGNEAGATVLPGTGRFLGRSSNAAIQLSRLQELLPKKELLEVYVGTKRKFLGLSYRQSQLTSEIDHDSTPTDQKPTWGQWLGLTKKIDPSTHLQQDIPSMQHDNMGHLFENNVTISSTHRKDSCHSLTFYDVEDDESLDYDIEQEEVDKKVFTKEVDEFKDVQETQLWNPLLLHDTKEEEDPSTIVEQLLSSGHMIAEIYFALESVSVELQVSCNSCLIGSMTSLDLAMRLDNALFIRLALNDLFLRYEKDGQPSQKILIRREALEKQLLSVLFCSKNQNEGAPVLFVDIQHVTMIYLPIIFKAVKDFFGTKKSSSSSHSFKQQHLNDIDFKVSHGPSLVSLNKLSLAKQIMYNEYRNVLMSISVAAPTIILPALSDDDIVSKAFIIPVLVIHLGALSIQTEKAMLPPAEIHPFYSGRLITYSAIQRFQVNLREIHVDYIPSYELIAQQCGNDSYSIINRFEVMVRTDFKMTEEKNIIAPFLHPRNPIKKSLRPTVQHSPHEPQTQSTESVDFLPQSSIDIHGDLPALAIHLNRSMFNALLAALHTVTTSSSTHSFQPEEDMIYDTERVNQVKQSDALSENKKRKKDVGLLYDDDLVLPEMLNPISSPKLAEENVAFCDSIQQIGKFKRSVSLQRRGSFLKPTTTTSLSNSTYRSPIIGPSSGIILSKHMTQLKEEDYDIQLDSTDNNTLGVVDTPNVFSTIELNETIQQPGEHINKTSSFVSQENEHIQMYEEKWPPDFRASFSLVRFEMTINCLELSQLNTHHIQVVTDRLSIELWACPGLTTIHFCLEKLTLLRPHEHDASPYRYLLQTEDESVLNTSVPESLWKTTDVINTTSELKTAHDVDLTNNLFEREMTPLDMIYHLKTKNGQDNLILIKIVLSDQTYVRDKYTHGAKTLITVNFQRYLKIIFQPQPLREFILFWKTGPMSKEPSVSFIQTDSLLTPDSNTTLITTRHILTRDLDIPSVIIRVSILGASCTCVEESSEAIFAVCEFEKTYFELISRSCGSDIQCQLNNLHITDLSSVNETRHWRRLFGVLPGSGCLLSISIKTTDKTAAFFDGFSLVLSVEFGEVEVVCLIGKLLRIFHWIFDGFLATLTASPNTLSTNESFQSHNNYSNEKLSFQLSEKKNYEKTTEVVVNHETNESSEDIDLGHPIPSTNTFLCSHDTSYVTSALLSSGIHLLNDLLKKAADCLSILGISEQTYLEDQCDYVLPRHQINNRHYHHRMPDALPNVIPPLTLRKYDILIKQPTLLIPVSTTISNYTRLTIESIIISNSPLIEKTFGLLDDIQIQLNNVIIRVGLTNDMILSHVYINIHFLRSLLNVYPQHPTWMTFRFSDVPWFLTPSRFQLLLNILNYNILGDDPDIKSTRNNDISSSVSKNLSQTIQYQQQTLGLSKKDNVFNKQSLMTPDSQMTESLLKEFTSTTPPTSDIIHHDIVDASLIWMGQEIMSSLYQFILPGLFVFLSPGTDVTTSNGPATIAFHADLLQCSINKNLQLITTIQVTAKSARILHCVIPESSFRVILSDSQQNLNTVYQQEITILERLAQQRHHANVFPTDVSLFIQHVVQRIQQHQSSLSVNDIHSCNLSSLNTQENGSLSVEDFLINEDHLTSPTHHIDEKCLMELPINHLLTEDTEELFLFYQSKKGSKLFSIKVFDPRLIFSKQLITDLTDFFNVPESHSIHPILSSDPQQTPVQHKIPEDIILSTHLGEVTSHITMNLIRASIIFPEDIENRESSLLIMRGTFEAKKNKVIDAMMSSKQQDDTISEKIDLNHPILLSSSVVSDTPIIITRSISCLTHYVFGVTDMEVVSCDLYTLNYVEDFQKQYGQHHVGINNTTSNTTPYHHRPMSHIHIDDILPSINHKDSMLFNVSIDPSKQKSSLLMPFRDILGLPVPFNMTQSLYDSQNTYPLHSTHPPYLNTTGILSTTHACSQSENMPFVHELDDNPTHSASQQQTYHPRYHHKGSTLNWEDLIRLLCPTVAFNLDITDRHTVCYCPLPQPTISLPYDETRHILLSLQPLRIELSYLDLLFLKRCFRTLSTPNMISHSNNKQHHDISPIVVSSVPDNQSYVSSQQSTSLIGEHIKGPLMTIDVDFRHVKLLILNDSMEFLSAPFIEVNISDGTLNGLFEQQLETPRTTIDLSMILMVRYFNPRAVAFEPIIELLKLRVIRSLITSYPLVNNHIVQQHHQSIELSIGATKKDPLCINMSNIFVATCLQNYHRWKIEFGATDISPTQQSHDSQILLHQSHKQLKSNYSYQLSTNRSGMFRFTPYSIRNHTGMSLRVTTPNTPKTNSLVSSNVFSIPQLTPTQMTRSSRWTHHAPSNNYLKPGEIHRLTQLQVDIRNSDSASLFNLELDMIDPIANICYSLDGCVPVDRLGMYLYRAITLPNNTDSSQSQQLPTKKKKDIMGYCSDQFIVCRVGVSEGQKHLTIESQVLIHNDLSDSLGLEVVINISTLLPEINSHRPTFIIPPNKIGAVPVYACGVASISFRPIIWDIYSTQKKQDIYDNHHLPTQESFNELHDTIQLTDPVITDQPRLYNRFTWSKGILLSSLWERVNILDHEHDQCSTQEIDSSQFKHKYWYPSLLPKFLPVDTLLCRYTSRSICNSSEHSNDRFPDRIQTMIDNPLSTHTSFFFSVVVKWDYCTHRDRQCKQLHLILKPPFKIKSTIPMNVDFQIESNYASSQREDVFSLSNTTQSHQVVQTQASHKMISGQKSKKLSTSAPETTLPYSCSSCIGLQGEIRLFSLPLLEKAVAKIDVFQTTSKLQSVCIFNRLYPHNSLTDYIDPNQWRRFWIAEGGQLHKHLMIPPIQTIRIFDKQGRSLRIQVIVESLPGHPVEMTIHAPVWLVSYIGINIMSQSRYSLAFSYHSTDDQDISDSTDRSHILLHSATSGRQGSDMISTTTHSVVSSGPDHELKMLVAMGQQPNQSIERVNDHIQRVNTIESSTVCLKKKKKESHLQQPAQDISISGGITTTSPHTRGLRHKYAGSIKPVQSFLNQDGYSEPIIGMIPPWCIPLDCYITGLQLVCNQSLSNDVSVNDIQEDQLIQLTIDVPTDQEQAIAGRDSISFIGSPSHETDYIIRSPITHRLCDLSLRVSQCPLPLSHPVKLITLSHRYLLQNNSHIELLYRQSQTTLVFKVPIGRKIPIEWAIDNKPLYICLKPATIGWQWGGRICPNSIESGTDFIYHLAPECNTNLHHCNIRIQKCLPSTTQSIYATTILKIDTDSPDLPDALQIVNHTRFDFTVRQHHSSPSRAFQLKKLCCLDFGWDDTLLEKSIYLFPDNPYYKKGALIQMAGLISGESKLIRFDETVCRFWFTIIASRHASLRLLHIYEYDESPNYIIEHPLNTPIIADFIKEQPRRLSEQIVQEQTTIDLVKKKSNLNKMTSFVSIGQTQCGLDGLPTALTTSQQYCIDSSNETKGLLTKKFAQFASIPTELLFNDKQSIVTNITCSITISFPAILISVISDLPISRVIVPEVTETLPDELTQRHNRISSSFQTVSRSCVPSELLTIYIEDCRCRYMYNQHEAVLALTINDIQIDNSLLAATFPVIVQRLGVSSSTTLKNYETRQLLEGVDLKLNIEKHALIDILFKRRLYSNDTDTREMNGTTNFYHFEVIRVIILGLIIKADMGFVTAALHVIKTYSNATTLLPLITNEQQSYKTHQHLQSDDIKQQQQLNHMHRFLILKKEFIDISSFQLFIPPQIEIPTISVSQKFYFETFLIHPLLLRFSFTPSTSSISEFYDHSSGLIMRLFSSIGSIQEVPIYFTSFRLQDESKMISALLAMLKASYSAQMWRQSYALATSVDLLGNPLSTLSHLGAGLGDLVAEPVRSYNQESDSTTVLEGFGKGAKSFWDNTVYGAFNVVSKVSGAAAQGLGVLAMDEQYAKERQQQGSRRRPKDASEGFTMGAEAFGKAFVGGLKGLVAEPSRGAEEKGFEGLVQGVGKGVVGALVKPVAGMFEMTALAAGGIQEAAGESSGVARGRRQRQRYPRIFYGADRIIRQYNYIDSWISDTLLYVPGIDWDTFIIDQIVYDAALNYVTILNDDEILTINLHPEPHADIYCDLWHIVVCEAVGPSNSTVSSGSKATVLKRQNLAPSDETQLSVQQKEIRSVSTSKRQSSRIRQSTTHYIFTGVLLKLHQPLASRCIRTSTLQIATTLTEAIQEKLARL